METGGDGSKLKLCLRTAVCSGDIRGLLRSVSLNVIGVIFTRCTVQFKRLLYRLCNIKSSTLS